MAAIQRPDGTCMTQCLHWVRQFGPSGLTHLIGSLAVPDTRFPGFSLTFAVPDFSFSALIPACFISLSSLYPPPLGIPSTHQDSPLSPLPASYGGASTVSMSQGPSSPWISSKLGFRSSSGCLGNMIKHLPGYRLLSGDTPTLGGTSWQISTRPQTAPHRSCHLSPPFHHPPCRSL